MSNEDGNSDIYSNRGVIVYKHRIIFDFFFMRKKKTNHKLRRKLKERKEV